MTNSPEDRPHPNFADAARFWERGRILYNAILAAILALWFVLTWPHFRPALTVPALGAFLGLGVLANLCYCVAYIADIAMQPLLPPTAWRRFRQVLWVLGMLLSILFENYWIADEIYPDVSQSAPHLFQGANAMWTSSIGSNMNFPPPAAVLGFLAACAGLVFIGGLAVIFWLAHKPRLACTTAVAIGTGTVAYVALLLAFSARSHEIDLARGQEKYFCEIDCHLAYSLVDFKTDTDANSRHYIVTLRTRFDETTTSASRPKDAPLTPSPREVQLIDSMGRQYEPVSSTGTSLITPLRPAESYTTQLEFRVPKEASGLRLLINTVPSWPDRVVIGDENSWLHKKTYFAL